LHIRANHGAPTEPEYEEYEKMSEIRMRITVGNQVFIASLVDNATTSSLIEMLPVTLPMMDLYSKGLVYRFPEELPANEGQTSGYEVGDISYWTPGHSFIIFYAQNRETISNLQKIGHIDFGAEILDGIGSVDVTFKLLDEL